MHILDFLVEENVLGKEEALLLKEEAKKLNKRVEEIILERKILPETKLFELKSEFLKIPFLKEIKVEEIPIETLKKIPETTAVHYKMIPLGEEEGTVKIGMVYPEDLSAKEALNFLSRFQNFNYQIFLITPSLFQKILERYQAPKSTIEKVLTEIEETLGAKEISRAPLGEEILAEEAPVSKMVGVFLKYGVDGEASDIHIEPLKEKTRIRFRRMGELHTSFFLPLKIHPAIVGRIKILANLRIDETRIPQDGRFSVKIEGRTIDFRVSTFPTPWGEKVVIRILDPKVGLKKFEDLGLSGRNFEIAKRALQKPYGMILVTGPTGSGKTTTLYAFLQLLNKEQVNIVTLEDPVEYSIEGVNQSQVRPEIGYDFAKGLRHVLRQDPDIIMVGEIRDQETASLAVHAALTGHLVLSTLHTNNAVGAIPRLLNLGIPGFLLSPAINIIIAQRLVRKLCEKCKKKVKASKEIQELIEKELKGVKKIEEPLYIWEAEGCGQCNKEGFSGRIGIFEVLEMTPELSEIITKNPTETKIMQEAENQGMITMRQDGFLKVLEGITTVEEVLRVTSAFE
jgi:type IV pilus assembly protein PilB